MQNLVISPTWDVDVYRIHGLIPYLYNLSRDESEIDHDELITLSAYYHHPARIVIISDPDYFDLEDGDCVVTSCAKLFDVVVTLRDLSELDVYNPGTLYLVTWPSKA